VDGTANLYQWMKDGQVIQDATDSSYTIIAATVADQGSYVCNITNTIATELTLYSRSINVTVSGAVGIENQSTFVPKTFSLNQNYPNPFNPKTIINYELPITNYVELNVYNLLGQTVVNLVSEKKSAGYHQVEWNALGFTSGIYIYRIKVGEYQNVKKMVLLR